MRQLGNLRGGTRLGAAIETIAHRARVAVVVVGLLTSNACYNYAAVPATEPLVEQRVELRINDAGRVQLTPQVGPGALTVEGRVARQDDSSWTLRVYRLTTITGAATTWSGEVVEVPNSSVELVTRRDFDRRRTMVAMAATAGAVTLFVLSRSIFGGGFGADGGDDPGTIGASIRR